MEVLFDQASGLFRYGNLAAAPGLTEDLLATAYLRLKSEGQLETIYYEGTPSLMQFMRTSLEPETISFGAFVDRTGDGKTLDFAGIAWCFDRHDMANHEAKAEVGFAFFRHCATPRQKVDLGKLMVDVLFGRYALNYLFGTTPVENKLALRYVRELGFKTQGIINNFVYWEGAVSAAQISCAARSEWKGLTQATASEARPDLDEYESQQKQLVEAF